MSQGDPPIVLLACPRYSGQMEAANARTVYVAASRNYRITVDDNCGGSLLAGGFNDAWCTALAMAEAGKADYFAMLHADIVPEYYWLDKLIPELHRCGADMLSVVSPLKHKSGVTSTGIGKPGHIWQPLTRLTLKEIAGLPTTFTAQDAGYPDDHPLLVNTGCWVVDLRKEFWRETDDRGYATYHFQIRDCIQKRADGTWCKYTEPEDWYFSRLLHGAGRVAMATTCVKLEHIGRFAFPNTPGWGLNERDFATEKHWGEFNDQASESPELAVTR